MNVNLTSVNRNQHGMSLVELMVASTIGIIIVMGVSHIFLGSKASYNLQNGIGRMHENARFAMDIMSRSIGAAGYTPSLTHIDAFNTANSLENTTANADLEFTVSSGTASDSIDVKYTSATDCLGNATAGEANDRFYIDGTNLMCLGNGSANAGIMAEGVENMQILYGEDTDSDGVANMYVNAGKVIDWDAIVSVRVALLLSTVESVGKTDTTKTYALLNTSPLGPFNDNLLRRVFTRTIFLRN